jgi:hypothetical protein
MKHDTYCQKQVRSFLNVAKVMYTDLGPWAADYYIGKVIANFVEGQGAGYNELLEDLSREERVYLTKAFRKVEAPPVQTIPAPLSAKAQAFIDILHSRKEASAGIVFVRERATVAAEPATAPAPWWAPRQNRAKSASS